MKEDLKNRLYEANQKKVLGLENKAVMGDFSKENIEPLAPSIINQRPKNSEFEKQPAPIAPNFIEQNPRNQALEESFNKDKEVLQQNQLEENSSTKLAEQTYNEIKPQEVTMLSKALNSEISESGQKQQEFNNPDIMVKQENVNSSVTSNEVKDEYTYIPSSNPLKVQNLEKQKRDNYTYIPSSENVLRKNQKSEDKQKYIPSQLGAKFNKTFDNSGLEVALRRADRAEQRAIQTLAGNFNYY